MAAEFFALILSSFPSACSFVPPCPYYLKEGKEEDEDEAGRMSDRRGDALWLLVAGDVVARCGDDIDQKRKRWPPVSLPER